VHRWSGEWHRKREREREREREKAEDRSASPSGKVSVLRERARATEREGDRKTGRNGAELKAPYDTQKDKDRGVGITSKSSIVRAARFGDRCASPSHEVFVTTRIEKGREYIFASVQRAPSTRATI